MQYFSESIRRRGAQGSAPLGLLGRAKPEKKKKKKKKEKQRKRDPC